MYTLHVTNNACMKQEQDGVVPKREMNVAGVAKGHQKVMRIIYKNIRERSQQDIHHQT